MGWSMPASKRFKKVIKTCAPTPPRTTMKRIVPRGLIAEIIFRLKRAPVTRTMGVSPFGAQVVPL